MLVKVSVLEQGNLDRCSTLSKKEVMVQLHHWYEAGSYNVNRAVQCAAAINWKVFLKTCCCCYCSCCCCCCFGCCCCCCQLNCIADHYHFHRGLSSFPPKNMVVMNIFIYYEHEDGEKMMRITFTGDKADAPLVAALQILLLPTPHCTTFEFALHLNCTPPLWKALYLHLHYIWRALQVQCNKMQVVDVKRFNCKQFNRSRPSASVSAHGTTLQPLQHWRWK